MTGVNLLAFLQLHFWKGFLVVFEDVGLCMKETREYYKGELPAERARGGERESWIDANESGSAVSWCTSVCACMHVH